MCWLTWRLPARTRRAVLRRSAGRYSLERVAHPQPGDWPTYHGQLSGNRYSALDQITPRNVGRLAPRWSFPVPNARHLEVTPVVVGASCM